MATPNKNHELLKKSKLFIEFPFMWENNVNILDAENPPPLFCIKYSFTDCTALSSHIIRRSSSYASDRELLVRKVLLEE